MKWKSPSRLEQIAKILEMDLVQILSFDDKQIFNISYNHNNHAVGGVIYTDEGFKMLIAHLQEENKELRSQIHRLLALLEKVQKM
jgi:hypothetical protein